jgi:hypothetical protein
MYGTDLGTGSICGLARFFVGFRYGLQIDIFQEVLLAVLPTYNNFLLDQPKNSAAGEKVRPHIKLTHKDQFCSFFNGS